MTTGTIDESQRKAARVAGFFYLLTFAIVVSVNFGINERLMVGGDPAQTARNILAHERLFRIGIASNLVYEAGLLTLLSALYVTLRPAGRTLALLAAFGRLVYASMWVLMSLNQLTALRLLNGADYLRVLGTEQAQTLGRLYLSGFDAYYVGLLFYGLASTVCSYLFFKSGYIPRGLAAFGVIVSAWAAACTLAFIISPDFAKHVNLWWFDTGLGLFELATGFWLMIKGLRRLHYATSAKVRCAPSIYRTTTLITSTNLDTSQSQGRLIDNSSLSFEPARRGSTNTQPTYWEFIRWRIATSFFLVPGNNDYGSLLLHIANDDALSFIEVDFRRTGHVLNQLAVFLVVFDHLFVGIRCRVRDCTPWSLSRIRNAVSAGIHTERAGRKERCEHQCQCRHQYGRSHLCILCNVSSTQCTSDHRMSADPKAGRSIISHPPVHLQ